MKPWFLYVLRCKDDTLYTGITTDIQRRFNTHQRGRGAKYTQTRRPVTLIGAWEFPGHADALRAERAFKRASRPQKLRYVEARGAYRDAPFLTGVIDGAA